MFKYILRNGALLALAASQALALQLPRGTEVQIRLKSKVGSQISRSNDAVEAEVIAPVMVGNVYAIPPGAAVHGVVAQAQSSTGQPRLPPGSRQSTTHVRELTSRVRSTASSLPTQRRARSMPNSASWATN